MAPPQTILKQDSNLQEFFYGALKPWVHYVPTGYNGVEEIDWTVQVCAGSCGSEWSRRDGCGDGVGPSLSQRGSGLDPVLPPTTCTCTCLPIPSPQFLRSNDDLARAIGQNARQFASTHLVEEGRSCYIKAREGQTGWGRGGGGDSARRAGSPAARLPPPCLPAT